MIRRNIPIVTVVHIIIYAITFGIIIYAKIVGMKSYDLFYEVVKEDGLAEYLTVLFLLGSAVLFGIRTVRSYKDGHRKMMVLNGFVVLLFIFGAGEEISWGQRLLNLETGDFFNEYNYQGETNFHNLELWGVNINKLIFSKLMFISLGFYFLVLPFLVKKLHWIRKLVTGFDVPMARLHHVIVFFVQNAVVLSMGLMREGELHELSLTAILFLIFLAPAKFVMGVPVRHAQTE